MVSHISKFPGCRSCASVILLFAVCTFIAQSSFAQTESAPSTVQPPEQVSALVYSSSAAELFWTPTENVVQVSRNGQVLGQFDSRSLFQPELDATENYHYELRSRNANGELSAAVIVSLSTRNFSLPVKRVYPVGQQNEVAPPPPEIASSDAVPLADEPTATASEIPTTVAATPAAPTTVAEPDTSTTSSDIQQTSDNCIARNVSTLLACVRNANAYERIDMANDIRCDQNCCPNGAALLKFNQTRNLTLNGHGHRLLRTKGQRQCSLLDINNASNIQVSNLRLDDDQRVNGCQVGDNCPRMVHIKHSADIAFVETHVSHGKGYAFYVQGTNGFRFERSVLHNSGVLGMYIGHGNDASSNVTITDSTFSDNQTNGLALLGVTGQSLSSNVVADNLFTRNHRMGQWAVAPRYGSGFTGGGQLYVAQASNVTVRNNVIRDGYCENCYVQRKHRSGVSGIELGRPNQQSVSHISVSGNTVVNLDGFGISQNANSSLSNNVSVQNNVMLNTGSGEDLQGARTSSNRVLDTQQFDSFESAADLNGSSGSRFTTQVSCSSNAAVARQCGVASRFGQCVAQLKLGEASCDDVRVALNGPVTNITQGQVAVLSGWVRSPIGRWCAVFRDHSGNRMSEQCSNLNDVDESDVQSFVGLPTIEAVAPSGAGSVQLLLEHQQVNSTMWVDDLKLSVGSSR